MFYGREDGWVDSARRDEFVAWTKGMEGVRTVIDRHGLPHAFCLKECESRSCRDIFIHHSRGTPPTQRADLQGTYVVDSVVVAALMKDWIRDILVAGGSIG